MTDKPSDPKDYARAPKEQRKPKDINPNDGASPAVDASGAHWPSDGSEAEFTPDMPDKQPQPGGGELSERARVAASDVRDRVPLSEPASVLLDELADALDQQAARIAELEQTVSNEIILLEKKIARMREALEWAMPLAERAAALKGKSDG